MPGDAKLTIEYRNSEPVLLSDLTESLYAISSQYKKFYAEHAEDNAPKNVQLYVKEMKSGSIIADLVDNAAPMLGVLGGVNTLIEFAKHLHGIFDFYVGRSSEKPDIPTKTDFSEVAAIINPTAKDSASQINITTTFNGDVHYHVHLDSNDSNAIQNRLSADSKALREPVSQEKRKVVLYWFQARSDVSVSTGDKGVIESISTKPVKIIFDNDDLKSSCLLGVENPFRSAYVVDVTVETIGNRPVAYKVTKFYEKFDKE